MSWQARCPANARSCLVLQGDGAALPSLSVDYTAYSRWQQAVLQGATLEQQLKYWQGQLADIEPLSLPADHPRPSVQVSGRHWEPPSPCPPHPNPQFGQPRAPCELHIPIFTLWLQLLAVQSHEGGLVAFRVPEDVLEDVKQLAQVTRSHGGMEGAL